MTDSALVWIGLIAIVGGVSTTHLVRTCVTARELDYWAVSIASLSCAGVLELGMANSYLPAAKPLTVLSGLATVTALVLAAVAIRTRTTG
ncbi:hypothetical protein [Natronorubrum daqingense]|uniref:Uncharacterized protein n=1 Tax=Natronorubrum daqingense TaxID=588898 RepID=A0A1N6YQ11_9EURY|nr:hypothetical protein [Natronorubrum daqingense]APX95600.1 hypothetical protein BB347_02645 [Natronorubrum daqingense]SIR16529.1 hypothetical protein SAMN05421809_0516 [Natronorubrum daqingense]